MTGSLCLVELRRRLYFLPSSNMLRSSAKELLVRFVCVCLCVWFQQYPLTKCTKTHLHSLGYEVFRREHSINVRNSGLDRQRNFLYYFSFGIRSIKLSILALGGKSVSAFQDICSSLHLKQWFKVDIRKLLHSMEMSRVLFPY